MRLRPVDQHLGPVALHQRRLGVASGVGIHRDIACIGVRDRSAAGERRGRERRPRETQRASAAHDRHPATCGPARTRPAAGTRSDAGTRQPLSDARLHAGEDAVRVARGMFASAHYPRPRHARAMIIMALNIT
jgi:deoxyinosine 3'endonuclease (endonuclease V)